MKKVYLSPSTQEKNIGANNYKSEEYRMNLVCNVTEKILKQHGVTVYRNKPTMSLGEVVRDSNDRNADIHFAIHSNAYNKKWKGCEIFCYKKGGEGEKLCKAVYKYISKLTPWADRGIKEGYNFYGKGKHMYEVTYTKMPASLIEIDFHDNTESAKWIIENISIIGENIAHGILDYLNIEYKPESKDIFPVTKEAKMIIESITKYSDVVIGHLEKNTHINLSGLFEKIWLAKIEAEKNYKTLILSTHAFIANSSKLIKETSNKTIEVKKQLEELQKQIDKLK